MIQLVEHFSRDIRSRHSDWLRQQRWFFKAKERDEKRKDIEEQRADDAMSLAADIVIAAQEEIEAIRIKLDRYDEANVRALMLNQEKLDAIDAQFLELLDRAYVMSDGRRVFLTEDGTRAYDETGKEVTRDELDFDLIPKGSPTWEQHQEMMRRRQEAMRERERILEFQRKVDRARDCLDEGAIPKSELDELDADLEAAMPSSVRAQMRQSDKAANAVRLNAEFSARAAPDLSARSLRPLSGEHSPGF